MGNDSKAGDSDAAVPLLRFGAKNNWLKFKEKLSIACTEKYGDLGRLIDSGEYWAPPKIKTDDYPDWENNDMQKYLYYDAQKSRQREIREMRDNRPRMFAYIKSKLSKALLDQYKADEEYRTCEEGFSVKGL